MGYPQDRAAVIARTIAHIYEASTAPFEHVLDYLRDEIPDIQQQALADQKPRDEGPVP
jgi:hypothetical protein